MESYRDIELYNKIKPYFFNQIGFDRFNTCYALSQYKVSGDIVECGVCNGGTLALLGAFNDSKLWGFDSWEGNPMPDPEFDEALWGNDDCTTIKCVGDIEKTKEVLFKVMGKRPDRVELVKGWFSDTIPVYKDKIEKIAILHIDGDWYDSVKTCLIELYDKVVENGIVYCSDYGFYKGCNIAVHEFLADKGVTIERPYHNGAYWYKRTKR